MSKPILGIDVAKAKLDVELMFDGGGKTLKHQFANSPKGHKLLQGWLDSLRIEQVHACLEATGTYGEAVAEFLFAKGHTVSVINPLQIKKYAQSDLRRNKTDRADAHTIADFCRAKDPAPWRPPSPEAKQLQALTRRIEALERMLIGEQNRLDVAQKQIRPSLQRVIRTLKKEISAVERLIKEHIDNYPDLKQQHDLLRSIPGIGKKTAPVLLGELEFAAFNSARSVAAHAGVTPGRVQSGSSIDWTRLSKLGNGRIRKALYFPAITAIKHNVIVKSLANRLSQKGKAPMQVICAAMQKLLHLAFGVIKSNRPFDPKLAFHT